MNKEILFITGNDEKFREFSEILFPIEIKREKIDLPELQDIPENIVKEKARIASAITKKTCFVDDTSLGFYAWKGLPGPYIKHFIKNIGNEKLAETLLKTSDNIEAEAICSIGYCEYGKNPVCFQGITKGKIVKPRGKGNFQGGWDPIFMPDEGKGKTFAEMTNQEKHAISHRKKAIEQLKKFLEKNEK